MKIILGMLLTLTTTGAYAQSVGAQDVEPMLQQMQASGKITAEQAEITRRYMKTMRAEDWQKIHSKAEKAIQRNPAAAEKIGKEGVPAIDMQEFNFND